MRCISTLVKNSTGLILVRDRMKQFRGERFVRVPSRSRCDACKFMLLNGQG
jgi:hypothetical protein